MIRKIVRKVPPLYRFLLRQIGGLRGYKLGANNMKNSYSYYLYGTRNPAKLKQFHNIHCGERCFIIGNGPSLKIADLEKLKKEYTFGQNRIYELFDKTDWRPTYYCMQDFKMISAINDKLPDIVKAVKYGFLAFNWGKEYKRSLTRLTNVVFFYLNLEGFTVGQGPQFTDDISVQIYEGSTVTYAAIQIAAYMGFKEIYLLGVDHSYKNDGSDANKKYKNYAEGLSEWDPNADFYNFPKLDNATLAYKIANGYAQKTGIKIYNATRGGCLEVFDRVDFDSIQGI